MAVSKQLLNEVSAYSLLKGNGYNLELISGKWFLMFLTKRYKGMENKTIPFAFIQK